MYQSVVKQFTQITCLIIFFLLSGCGDDQSIESSDTHSSNITLPRAITQARLAETGSLQAYLQVDDGSRQQMVVNGSNATIEISGLSVGAHQFTITIEYLPNSDPQNPVILTQTSKQVDIQTGANTPLSLVESDFSYDDFDDDNDGVSNLNEILINNAKLQSIVLSAGSLNETFESSVTEYTANVAYEVSSLQLTASTHNVNASLRVSANGVNVPNGGSGGAISLAEGNNTIILVVTAEDGTTTQTYTLVVTRAAYTIGGTVSGLAGSGLVLQNNSGDDLIITTDGRFTFDTALADGSDYSVTVATQPTTLNQTCSVSNASGTLAGANASSVSVVCVTDTYTINSTVNGLAGTGLVLQNNSGDNLSVSADGTFSFTTSVTDGTGYEVSVLTQPSTLNQLCTVSNGIGTVAGADVTNVNIACVTNTYTIKGTVNGLAGSGLVLQNNGGDNLSVSADGTFSFTTSVTDGTGYAVSVFTQPSTLNQLCTVSNGSGTVAGADVTNVNIACVTNTYTIKGTVNGLAGSGLVLQNNGGDNLSVSADGTFSFTTSVTDGTGYAVSVLSQPSTLNQLCTISNGSGTVAGADVTNVNIACVTNTYTIKGTVNGLAGSGLVLQNNGGDDLSVSANGTFSFTTSVTDGTGFGVSVLTQPSTVNQLCTVSNGSGSIAGADVTNVNITCVTNTYTISGTVSGLAGSGLVLQNNSGDDLTITTDGSFTFDTALADGSDYSVTVATQPTTLNQTCSVSNASDTLAGANASNVSVVCVTDTYTIGGSISGLAGTGLVLQNNGGDNLSVSADGTFSFTTSVTDGTGYEVSVLTQPSTLNQLCTVSNGSGSIAGADITNVSVVCATNTYTIGGTVSGLSGSGLVLQNNSGDDLNVSADGTFSFTTSVTDGTGYEVSVLTQPSTPNQVCTVSNGSGTVAGADVTNVNIACVTNTYTISGTVSGLAGSGLVLQNNSGDDLTISADGRFTFDTALADGSDYSVTVVNQPSTLNQTCSVTNASDTLAGANASSVSVVCVTDTYTIGGTVSGLAGSGLVLQNNSGDDLTISADGSFTFASALVDGSDYSVTVVNQPSTLNQICSVSNASDTLAGANASNVSVVCATNTYTIGGTISGLAGSGLVLQNNSGDDLTITTDGSFTFDTAQADGSDYSVTVATQPSALNQICSVSNASDTLAGANTSNVSVVCATNTYTINGTVNGLAGTGLVLQNNSGDDLNVSADGTFSFTTSVTDGTGYEVSVLTQPSTPNQLCTVSNGSGTVAGADVTNVNIACVTNTYTINGTVNGLAGSGLVLQNNSGDDLTITTDGRFTFDTALADGSDYSVTVATQPSALNQTCSVSNASGTLAGANASNVSVVCATNTYTIGGTVSGLAGSGLALQNNSGDDLTITTDGSFTFDTALADGSDYSVTVATQPSALNQICSVSNASDTLAGGNASSVSVVCATNTYTIGGTISGLAGSGLVLQNNSGDDLTITTDGSFTFDTAQADGSDYSVTVATQPSALNQICSVSNASGTLAGANASNVSVVCATNTYTIGGTVSGLAGSGLVLQNNSGDDLTISADGSFTFASALVDGSDYSVTVVNQPSTLSQTCSVSNASGTLAGANASNVSVVCATNTYTIGGTVSGLAGSGLVLQNNSGDDLSVSADGPFSFTTSVTDGTGFRVSVLTQPSTLNQLCTISNGSGTVAGADVTNVSITCVTNTYTVKGTVSGLAGSGLVLQNNSGDNLSVSTDGTFIFSTSVTDGTGYEVSVLTQPSTLNQVCTVSNGSGSIAGADVTNVSVVCITNTYTIGGTVNGLAGSGLVLQNNKGDNLSVSTDGTFSFTTSVTDGTGYEVSVLTQPSTLNQVCTVSNGSGTVAGVDVTNVSVVCVTNTYTIGGTVSGLAGTGLVLQNNGGDDLTISADGSFTFATALADSSDYSVAVATQPSVPNQICSVTNASGTLGANVTNVSVVCANTYTIGGTVSGLSGSGNGAINPGSATVNHGSTTSFTVTPDIGYSIDSVTGCGGSLSGNTYTTGAITAACTVNASFKISANNANLQSLELSTGSLTFNPQTTSYTVNVAYTVSSIQVTGNPLNSSATLTVNGVSTANNSPSASIELFEGSNPPISVKVTSADGTTIKNYALTINRRAPTTDIADLSALSLSTGDMDQIFQSTQPYYTASVDWLVKSFQVTATSKDAGASLTINGVVVASGVLSNVIELTEGENLIEIIVTAADNVTQRRYTITLTRLSVQNFAQRAYIKASNADANDHFGTSVSLSGDTLAVGAYQEDSLSSDSSGNIATDTDAGAVYVFTRSNGVWSQQAYLKASNAEEGDHFGVSVSLSGNTLAVGADYEASAMNGDQGDNTSVGAGAVYVFTRSNGLWSQQAYLKASNPNVNEAFGGSVSLSGDTLAVGASFEATTGAVHVFTRSNGVWSQQDYLKASNANYGDSFGASVSLSGDTLAVGAYGEDSAVNGGQGDNTASYAGAVYVFTRSNGVWSQQAYLKASNAEADDFFGWNVSLLGDTLAVGAQYEDSAATEVNGDQGDNTVSNAGAVYVFTRSGGVWSQQAYLKASNNIDSIDSGGMRFGNSLSLSGDMLAVGAMLEDGASAGVNGDQTAYNASGWSGAVYVFTRSNGMWSQKAYVKASNTGFGDSFGFSVSLSGDTLAVGGHLEDSTATGVYGYQSDYTPQSDNTAQDSGAVYVFR